MDPLRPPNTRRRALRTAFFALLAGSWTLFVPSAPVGAAATIVVNSTADIAGDDGQCTLREAIISANFDVHFAATPGECASGSGVDDIEFNITGAADFVNDGEDGYRIELVAPLPSITGGPVHIDGFSQSGSLPNTAPNPQPLNTRILIEIDGTSAGMTPGAGESALNFQGPAAGSSVRGLSIMNMGLGEAGTGSSDPTAIGVGAPDIVVSGNYIGTDHTGLADRGNLGCGVCQSGSPSTGAQIGGSNPEDRNVIVGNDQAGISQNSGGDDWVVQGNYIGLAADGVTAIGNSTPGESGGLSIDNCDNFLLGGDELSEMNVISGNESMGVAPDEVTNLRITGNRIGTDWSGTVAVENAGDGISLTGGTDDVIGGLGGEANLISGNGGDGIVVGDSEGTVIAGNLIGSNVDGTSGLGNGDQGINVSSDASGVLIGGTAAGTGNLIMGNAASGIQIDASTGVTVLGNTIGTTADGLAAEPNTFFGINVGSSATDVQIGNSTDEGSNLISGNTIGNVAVVGLFSNPSDVRIQGNRIGPNSEGEADGALTQPQAVGVFVLGEGTDVLIGGPEQADGNQIVGNKGAGVLVARAVVGSAAFDGVPTDISIIGNTISGTEVSATLPGSPNGYGIDLVVFEYTGGGFVGMFDSYSQFGRNPLSVEGETDGEANDHLNHPVIIDSSVSDASFEVGYDLVAAGSGTGQYRVEFFANESEGSVEGQQLIGSVNTSPGTGLSANLSVGDGASLVGNYVTATATRIDGEATNEGFGATSEFSESAEIVEVSPNPIPTSTTTTTSSTVPASSPDDVSPTTVPAVPSSDSELPRALAHTGLDGLVVSALALGMIAGGVGFRRKALGRA